MFTVLVIILIAAGLYLTLCIDDRLPETWNHGRILRNLPLSGMPTTNGFLLGIIILIILLLIHSALA